MNIAIAIVNKRAGKCACGAEVPAGAGKALKNADTQQWFVRCAACEGGEARPAKTAPATNVIPLAKPFQYTLLSGHQASPYQAAVFDHFKTGHGSIIVKAVAGSGKTTTMKNALRYLPEWMQVQLFAFNTEAAAQLEAAIEELRERDGRAYKNFRAGTFHSVGLRAILRFLNLGDRNLLKVESSKCRKLLQQMLGMTEDGKATYELYNSFVTQLVAFAKGEGVGCLLPDLDEHWYRLIEHHGLYLDSMEADEAAAVKLARELLAKSNEVAKSGWLDFDDQLYLVILWKLRLYPNHVVICDEAQDTNPVRRAFLHLSLKTGGRLYAVGDPKQSIYGFTGASTDAMELIATEFKTQELPLTVSYRCARAIVQHAQQWVPYIEAAPSAPEGEVREEVPLWQALAELEPSDAILCRQTAPLVSVAYGLLARNRPCRILGKSIGDGLVNLIEQQRASGIDRLIKKLETFKSREMAKFIAKGEEVQAEAVADRVNCILVLIEALPETKRTIPGLIGQIKSMFEDDKEGAPQTVLTLATQHRSKGKEWDRVVVLRPELNPSRAARQEWQEDQEFNLMYVTASRAKELLIYAAAKDMKLDKEAA